MENNKIIPKNKLKIIYEKIKELINENFKKLITIHKNILVKYLYKLIVLFGIYFYSDNFMEQLYLNKYQDIFSLLVLMMPYYDLNKSKSIITLDELFLNKNNNSKNLESSYYIDHLELNSDNNSKINDDYLNKYFNSVITCINNTLSQIHCLILPNWCNIFPYTMETYKYSNIYINFKYMYTNRKFMLTDFISILIKTDKQTDYDFKNDTEFILGYPILYGTIYNFLYTDIKNIKWLIYDLNISNIEIIPNIIYIGNKLEINSIINKPWNKLSEIEKEKFNNLWKQFYLSENTNFISLRSLVLFYLRWEKDNNKLNDLKFDNRCLKLININLQNLYEENEENGIDIDDLDDIDNIEFESNQNNILNECLNKIYPKINYESIYNYIYECMHKFRYTWYGYCCLDENKNILTKKNYFEKYFLNSDVYLNLTLTDNKEYFYITPKNIYNFFKALIHYKTPDNKYIPLSLEPRWNNINFFNKVIFIKKINNIEIEKWFNINKNIKRTYPEILNPQIIMNKYIKIFTNSSLIVDIILQTLVYNGMLTYFKYNPTMTDNNIIPNKNSEYKKWESYILSNININSYSNSYHAFSNTMLKIHGENTIKTICDSKWYTNFGANWIAQIQLFHHYLHNRVIFITGATGAGKSTLSPFLLVYAVKILNFNNNAKVVCTQSRTQPVKDNSEQISKNIGIPITIKKNKDLDEINELYKNVIIGEAITEDINYIQYKHKNGSLIDDLYHPYLRLYTDGSLYNIIRQNYFFKKSVNINNKQKYLSTNIFDIILVDEAHEHNVYMDMILTLSKFGTYINNQVTLGIISATMDNDEIIYRKFFEPIDDNWKAPLNVLYHDFYKIKKIEENFDTNLIDRRIHLSIPFGGMNFEVKEYPNKENNYPQIVNTFTDIIKINNKVIEIVKYILSNTLSGDILIFQPGENDIKKLVIEINKQTPLHVLAIPFYSKLDNEILENIVKKIDKKEVRNKIRYPKNKIEYDITNMFDIPQNEMLPEGTYTRFIIIATNIAEPSITIDSLEYVIDTGNQKIAVYNSETNQDNLEIKSIAIPNQKQRKGRVGRVKPGNVYYTYDRTILDDKVIYKINIQNISSFILELTTSSNQYFINYNSDPYKVNSDKEIVECLRKQYQFISYNQEKSNCEIILYNNTVNIKNASNIIYPLSDGKYELKTLEDNNGKFYIIHPNEDYFIRNIHTLEIIDIKPNYFNKITKAFEYGKYYGIIGNDNLLTPYGILVNSIVDFIEILDNPIDYTRIILDYFSFDSNINFEIYKNILMFIIFKITTVNLKVSNYLLGKADYLIYSTIIDNSFYTGINFQKDIFNYLDPELKNLNKLVEINVNKLINEKLGKIKYNNNIINKLNYNINEIKKLLNSFYLLKFKIDIIIYKSNYILKKNLDTIIIDLIKERNNISKEYSFFFNKILLLYTNSKLLLKISDIKNIINEFENYTINIRLKNKFIINIINKINNILNNSLFNNEFLLKINLNSNKIYSQNIINNFLALGNYDKLCFIICKNLPQNIVIKIPDTEFYINYYKKDINKIYSLEKNIFKINNKIKSYILTKVPNNIRNYFIFAVSMNDSYELNNIMVLSELVIVMLKKYFDFMKIKLFFKNTNFNREYSRDIYQEIKYNNILKKIDKIIKYIVDN